MSKGLEALERVEKWAIVTGRYTQDLDIIKKELKALGIIKKYPFIVNFILARTELTQEEYKILEEELS